MNIKMHCYFQQKNKYENLKEPKEANYTHKRAINKATKEKLYKPIRKKDWLRNIHYFIFHLSL